MNIADLLTAWRYHEHMSIREAAERVGLAESTLRRIERGYPMQGETLVTVLRWMLSESPG